MTDLNQDFNYLSKGYDYNVEKPKRSLRKKLIIVISFVTILAITPSLIFAISEIDFSANEKIAADTQRVKDSTVNKTTEVYQVTIETPQGIETKEAVIINNDSYWKISKRVCGEGKYYLSVQDQNDSKPLFEGDLVTVNCTL